MKNIHLKIVVFFGAWFFMSCDYGGNLFITNGYEYDVIVRAFFNYDNSIVERTERFYPGRSDTPAARHDEYRHLVAIQIETLNGELLAKYAPDYLFQLRKAYGIKKNQMEFWIFNERGLFFERREIDRRYNFEAEKILEYYRSDEAVQEQEALLKEAGKD